MLLVSEGETRMLSSGCSFVHTIPAPTIAAEVASIRRALQKGGYRKADSLLLREAAIGSLIDDLHDAANNLSVPSYSLYYRTDGDGNLEVALTFGHVADMVLFKIRVS
jgi:hypothetical protein